MKFVLVTLITSAVVLAAVAVASRTSPAPIPLVKDVVFFGDDHPFPGINVAGHMDSNTALDIVTSHEDDGIVILRQIMTALPPGPPVPNEAAPHRRGHVPASGEVESGLRLFTARGYCAPSMGRFEAA